MAYTTINKSTDNFRIKLYTGNQTARSITFDESTNMQPDLFWLKPRSGTYGSGYHRLFDSVRGAGYQIYSNANNAENYNTAEQSSFDTNGFSLGNETGSNGNSTEFVSWNWKANGAGSSNTDGSITSTVSANTTAGFSISKYTGNQQANASIGHGLGVAPDFVIIKRLESTQNWYVWHKDIGNNYLELNATSSQASGGLTVSATTITFPNTWTIYNASGETFVCYAFASKTGYSKFGSYTGNGSSDGTFVYTGFKPAFVIYKGATGANATDNWEMADNKRSPYNGIENVLYPNLNNAEGTGVTTRMDFLSNGFKMRTTGSDYNGSGQTYIYMAFGQSLVGSNNVPCTAR